MFEWVVVRHELTEHQFEKKQIEQLLVDYENGMNESLLEKAVDAWRFREIWE